MRHPVDRLVSAFFYCPTDHDVQNRPLEVTCERIYFFSKIYSPEGSTAVPRDPKRTVIQVHELSDSNPYDLIVRMGTHLPGKGCRGITDIVSEQKYFGIMQSYEEVVRTRPCWDPEGELLGKQLSGKATFSNLSHRSHGENLILSEWRSLMIPPNIKRSVVWVTRLRRYILVETSTQENQLMKDGFHVPETRRRTFSSIPATPRSISNCTLTRIIPLSSMILELVITYRGLKTSSLQISSDSPFLEGSQVNPHKR